MARAYSDDLRKKVLGAYASGKGTLRQLAERFDVSYGWVAKIHAAELATGHRSRVPQRRRPSGIDGEKVRQLVRSKPDIVLRELREQMLACGQPVSSTQLWRVLKKLGLRLKKVGPRHRARQRREPPPPRSLRRKPPHGRAGRPDLPG